MTTRRPFRRPGLTLTEALVATFIAAIGLISLMALFPLGALQMKQALKDERTGQLAMIADAKMRLAWRTNVIEVYQDPFAVAFDNPLYPAAPDTAHFPTPTGYEPSYPVFVDPIGWTARTGNPQTWVGDYYNPTSQPSPATVCLPRRTLFAFTGGPYGNNGIDTVPKAVQFSGLLDDLTYDDGGGAARPGPVNSSDSGCQFPRPRTPGAVQLAGRGAAAQHRVEGDRGPDHRGVRGPRPRVRAGRGGADVSGRGRRDHPAGQLRQRDDDVSTRARPA